MAFKLNHEAPNVPSEELALRRLQRHVEFGELGDLPLGVLSVPRYLVTYMNSQTQGRLRSATIVSVTNQSNATNHVRVAFYKGFSDDASPVGVATFSIPPDYTVDFGSRDLPGELTVVNAVPDPELTFDEGRAIVSSRRPEIGVSARVVYTRGDDDLELLAITDSKIVRVGRGNRGD